MELEHAALTETIIGAAIEVHREIGPGFKESIYQNALQIELRHRGLSVATEHPIVIEYRGLEVGRHRLDLVVSELIVVENKRVEELVEKHFSQLRSYLKAARLKHGWLFNFANAKLEIKSTIPAAVTAAADSQSTFFLLLSSLLLLS